MEGCLKNDSLPTGDPNSVKSRSYYWGKIDQVEAERVLAGKEEGTYLLRDSSLEDFPLTVSFRKNERTLHVRVERPSNKFTLCPDDPEAIAFETVSDLIEYYNTCKSPGAPKFLVPLHRT